MKWDTTITTRFRLHYNCSHNVCVQKKKEMNENKKILPALAPMSMEHMPTAMFVHEQLVDSLEDFARCWQLIP
jgi:hypothetical protein